MYFVSSRCLFPTAHFLQQNTGWWFICWHHMRHVILIISHKGTEACSSLQKHEITSCKHIYASPFPQIYLIAALRSDKFHCAWLRICHCMFMNACVVLLCSKIYQAQQWLHLGSGKIFLYGHFQTPPNQLWDESQIHQTKRLCFKTIILCQIN